MRTTDEHADAQQHDAEQERHAPAPGHELLVRQRTEDRKDGGRHQKADRHSRLHPTAIQTAAAPMAVFDGHQDGSAPFAADSQPLNETQGDQGKIGARMPAVS